MNIFTPYENFSDMFVVNQNVTHIFGNVVNTTANHIIYPLWESFYNSLETGFSRGFYLGCVAMGMGISFCLFGLFINILIEFPDWFFGKKPKKLQFVQYQYFEQNFEQKPYDNSEQNQQPEPTFDEQYPHKFEHIIRYMDMFDYDGADDIYIRILNKTQILANVSLLEDTDYDLGKLVELIQNKKITRIDDVFHHIMNDEHFKIKNENASFYYDLYWDHMEEEFNDFCEIISKVN